MEKLLETAKELALTSDKGENEKAAAARLTGQLTYRETETETHMCGVYRQCKKMIVKAALFTLEKNI